MLFRGHGQIAPASTRHCPAHLVSGAVRCQHDREPFRQVANHTPGHNGWQGLRQIGGWPALGSVRGRGPSLLIHTWIAFSLVIGAIARFCTKPSKWQTRLAVGQRHRSVVHAVDAVQRYEFYGLQRVIQLGDHGRLLAHRCHCIGRPAGADQNHGGSRIRDRHRWIDRTSRSARGTSHGHSPGSWRFRPCRIATVPV